MQVVKLSNVKPEESHDPIFRGKVTRQSLIGDSDTGMRVAVINFSKGAVNVFHTHTFDQVLYVTKGKGIVATEDKEVTVTPGTVILIPAGERHWHGATPDSEFSHIAVMPPGKTAY